MVSRGPTDQELYQDRLMGYMQDTLIGDDYTSAPTIRAHRLQRIDEFLHSLKQQGLLSEYAAIDNPLARIGLLSTLEGLCEPHYPDFVDEMPGRHGRDNTTVNFTALHNFMKKRGFTPEASALFRNPQTQQDRLDIEESWRAAREFTGSMWGKIGSTVPPDVLAQQTEPRHLYRGMSGLSGFAAARSARAAEHAHTGSF